MSKRILIADDHKSTLRCVRAMLEAHPDWTVCGEAVNGREALMKAIELRPDLVILDFAMPELNGLRAADEIAKLLPGVQIVLHTMYGAGVVLEANKHPVCRVIEKGNTGALVLAVEELLANMPQPLHETSAHGVLAPAVAPSNNPAAAPFEIPATDPLGTKNALPWQDPSRSEQAAKRKN